MNVKVFCDGAVTSNPGRGSWGWFAEVDRKIISHACGFMGDEITNNEAEYMALIDAMQWAGWFSCRRDDVDDIRFHVDSQLVANHMNREWRVRAENLIPFFNTAQAHWEFLDSLHSVHGKPSTEVRWIPREVNELADAMSHWPITHLTAVLGLENST